MSNLENLKKQAKLYLRWHRDREYTVAATIRAWLSKYDGLTDAQVLDASFKLSDAQELVARRSGYDNWAALRAGVDDLQGAGSSAEAGPPTPDVGAGADAPRGDINPLLIHALAHVFVADIDASCAFFRDKLGFTIVFTYGAPPFFAEVARDRARICLRCVDQPLVDGALRDREDLITVGIGVGSPEELTRLYLDFEAAGVVFHQTIKRHPWGARDFIVKDPDGNLISFGASAA
jgi:catechol 2,3-dioxygenase-like lactoylglutathione lyase family enzyme